MTFHETILKKLLEYRETHPNFNFLTRQRSGSAKRFESGHWFQGNDKYAFVGLINASGGITKTRSVGLAFEPKEYGFNCTLQVRFNGEKRDELISCYKKVISQIGGFNQKDSERFDKNLGKISHSFSELFDFLDGNYQSIISVFKKGGCEDVLVSDQKFSELITNVNTYRLAEKSIENKPGEPIKYFLVGSYWDDSNPADQTSRFYENSFWENGYDDKFIDDVNSVPVGSKIAIKAAFTREKTKSVMAIKARGTVIKNYTNGKKLEVKWEKDFSPFEVGFSGGYWATINEVTNQEHIKNIWSPIHSNQPTIDARVIYAYLKNSLSHRKIQKDILGEEAPARGGGFLAMTILHNYDIQKDKKGILNRNSFRDEYYNAKGSYANALALLKVHYPEFNVDITNNIEMDYPLNTILYGPPGTGKTYKLKEKYFENFTISESSLSKEQFILNLVADLTWWQTFAIALYDSGKTSVNEILENEIVKAKSSLSSAKNIRPIAWSRMQAHAVADCPNVNVSDSSEPSLFYKEEDSEWRVINENVEHFYPEGIELLARIKEYQPRQDKAVKNYEFVTFHQSYSYEDFIEGIKPKLQDESSKLEYEINDGIFKKLCQRAEKDLENNYAIFIDEINRGNVSGIFGELITLIEDDKRIGQPQELKVKLPYSKTEFGVPPNLYIIGTMNTADRSVEALDTALRRRFSFVEMNPNPKLLEGLRVGTINLNEVLQTINERVELLVDKDHTIGHAYLMNLSTTKDLAQAFANKIIPLLQEYFYGDYGKIGLVLGEGFIEKVENKKVEFATFKYEGQNDFKTPSFNLKAIDEKSIVHAVELLLGKKEIREN